MNITRPMTALALGATLALAGACSKSETASSTASQPPATASSSQAGITPDTVSTPVETQPSPGAPVATFTPSTGTAAPMLPTRDASAAMVDEHGHSTAKSDVRRIGPEEAAMLLQSGDAVLLDVRSKEAWEGGHIKGAVHIPYAEIAGRARTELPPTRWIIPYCT
jgi:hypothetical protein